MKIRSYFVNNSSSSSFVAVGIEIPDNIHQEICQIDNLREDFYLLEGDEYGIKDNKVVLAKIIVDIDGYDDYISNNEFTMQGIISIGQEINNYINSNINNSDYHIKGEVKIYCGTRMV